MKRDYVLWAIVFGSCVATGIVAWRVLRGPTDAEIRAVVVTDAQMQECQAAFVALEPMAQDHIRRVEPGHLNTAICMTCSCAFHPDGMGEGMADTIREIPWLGGKMIVCTGGLMP